MAKDVKWDNIISSPFVKGSIKAPFLSTRDFERLLS